MNSYHTTNYTARRKAVIYVRISDPKQKKKGDGINSQETTCRQFAKFRNLEVEHVFRDVLSGKYAARDGMEEMLTFLRKHRRENYVVIIDDLSRLARNYFAHFGLRDKIREAGGELMCPSHEFTDDPTRQMPEKIVAIVKEQERLDNAARVLSRSKARMQSGFYVFAAPRGYKYAKDKSGRGGKVLARDEPVASVVQDMLEKFASGVLSSQIEVKRYLEDHPQFPKTASGKIGKDRAKSMLTQPLYAGYIEHEPWGIGLTKAQHEPLVNFETYLRIQDRLAGRTKNVPVRLDINPEFPLRGLVECAECDTLLRAARSKGRSKFYSYYACHNKECDSYGKSIKKEKIEGDFETLLTNLSPSKGLIEIATHMFKTIWDKHHAGYKERQSAAKNSLQGIEQKIDNLVTRIVSTTQPTLISAYESELARLENRRIEMSEQIERLSGKNSLHIPDFESAYRTTMTFIANPCFLWRSSHIGHKRAAVKLCFGGRLSYDRNKGYRTAYKTVPFQIFQRLTNARKENSMQKEWMVGGNGFEPLTLSV